MKTIRIKNEEYPVKFGLLALKTMLGRYKLKKLVETESLMMNLEVEYLPKALKLGIDNGCKIAGIDPPTQEDINDAFECDLSLMTTTIDILSKDISGEPEHVTDEKKEEAQTEKKYKK